MGKDDNPLLDGGWYSLPLDGGGQGGGGEVCGFNSVPSPSPQSPPVKGGEEKEGLPSREGRKKQDLPHKERKKNQCLIKVGKMKQCLLSMEEKSGTRNFLMPS